MPGWQTLRQRSWVLEMPARWLALLLALWCVGPLNQALWLKLASLADFPDPWALKRLALAALLSFATWLWLMLWSWPLLRRPAWSLTLLLAAAVQYNMLHYGVVMDSSMLRNVQQTHLGEAWDLLSPGLLLHILLYAGLPILWLWRGVRTPAQPWRQALLRSGGMTLLMMGLLLAGAQAMYRELAPLLRNHTEIRYQVNPLATVVSWVSVNLKPIFKPAKPFRPIIQGASLGASYAAAAAAAGHSRPPLLVLVVGETARGDHFGLNGYPRDTTPHLQARNVISWRAAQSCGTNTIASVPCMFSPLGKAGYEGRKAEWGNLLDVLQAAGLAVDWLDNQAGCKGVCERLPHAEAISLATPAQRSRWCQEGECQDRLMTELLDQRLAALPEAARRQGAVLVLHQMGSHGPAYYRRSLPDTKRYRPECDSNRISSCSHAELVNVYDNSIAETDAFLAQAIDWLQARQEQWATALMYVGDHGESLGENGIYLHGLPYAIAPKAQTHVPWVLWPGSLAERAQLDARCTRASSSQPISHDNYFHTVLGLLDVHTPWYQKPLDILAPCRSASG